MLSLLDRQRAGRLTPGQLRSRVKAACSVDKIYFPTRPSLDNGLMQDAILKVIKSATPGTARIMVDFGRCPLLQFAPGCKSWVIIEFVAFGNPSAGTPFYREITSEPTMFVLCEQSNEILACFVFYQESTHSIHYAKPLTPIPVNFCDTPLKEPLYGNSQHHAMVDLAHVGIGVWVIPLGTPSGVVYNIRSMLDDLGAVIDVGGVDQVGVVFRESTRIF